MTQFGERGKRYHDPPWVLPSRTDATGKHQVELLRLANFVISIRVANVVKTAKLAELRPGEIIQLINRQQSASGLR
jgi:hypothetical protein